MSAIGTEKELRRMTVSFPPRAAAALADIRDKSKLKEFTQVIMAAVTCYLALLKVDRENRKIYVLDKDDGTKRVPYSPDIEFSSESYKIILGQLRKAKDITGPKNFAFTGDFIKKIEEAQRLTHYTTKADVIRASLSSFHELMHVKNNGDSIVVQNRDGTLQPFSPFSPYS